MMAKNFCSMIGLVGLLHINGIEASDGGGYPSLFKEERTNFLA